MQRDAGSPVALPVKCRVDHHRLRHAPCVITEILRQIFLLITDHVSEHLICPTDFSSDSLCIGIEKEFRTVKTQPALWIVRTGNAKTVQLAGARIGQKHVPDLISLFRDRDTNVLFGVLDIVEQAQLNTCSMLGKNGEIDAIPHPCRTQRIRITEESPHGSHKRAAHLSSIGSALATAK